MIDLATVKKHLRVDTADDDDVIAGFVATVMADLDGPTGWFGRSLSEQTLCLTAGGFPGGWADWSFFREFVCRHSLWEIRLPFPPIRSIVSITYQDTAGVSQTVDPTTYALADRLLFPLSGVAWPATAVRPDAVSITFTAGYDADKLPPSIRTAMLLKIGALYTNRNDSVAVADSAADRLLAPLRVHT